MTTRTICAKTTKQCELCKDKAGIFCEPDAANLCWACDARVHSANFLVARHSRNLLCSLCRSPTPWRASGPKVDPTLCLCQQCLLLRQRNNVDLDRRYPNAQEVVEESHVVPWSPPPEEEEEDEEFGSDRESKTGRADR